MADILDMQNDDEQPETPEEEKASHVSYGFCRNSYTSQYLCWRW